MTRLPCDHRHDAQVEAIFEQILATAPTIDILLNAVWGGYDDMVENGIFTRPVRSGNSRAGAGT